MMKARQTAADLQAVPTRLTKISSSRASGGVLAMVLLVGLLCGCHSTRETNPARTATEQLLISTASDHTVRDFDVGWLQGKKIFVEDKYFDSYDKGYVISSIRQHLSESGALLMKTDDKADIIVEIRSGALSVNNTTNLIGIPSIVVPVPFSGPLQTPEIAFYKSARADAIGKLALFAYERDTGEHVRSTGPISGYAHFRLYTVLGYTWKRTDIPELKGKPK